MEIIAFGDIHMASGRIRDIPGIREAELVILTGDLTNCGGSKEVRKVLDDILAVNPRVLAQFGNMDRPEVNEYLEALDINLHGQARLVDDTVCLAGLGGSNRTPFHTPSEFAEDELLRLGRQALEQGIGFKELAEPLHRRVIPLILVSHVPPFGTAVDALTSGRHVGSTAVRSLIERYRPDLCITGHIHEGRGTETVSATPVINPGALASGCWARIVINNSELTYSLQ